MINPVFMECAATYLYSPYNVPKNEPKKKERKVEAVCAVYCGKKFNPNADKKAQHSQIDILI